MDKPNLLHEVPVPHPSVAGRNNDDKGSQRMSVMARLWRPRNAGAIEPEVATLARFAGYVIDRVSGKAYSADEVFGVSGKRSPGTPVYATKATAVIEAAVTVSAPIGGTKYNGFVVILAPNASAPGDPFAPPVLGAELEATEIGNGVLIQMPTDGIGDIIFGDTTATLVAAAINGSTSYTAVVEVGQEDTQLNSDATAFTSGTDATVGKAGDQLFDEIGVYLALTDIAPSATAGWELTEYGGGDPPAPTALGYFTESVNTAAPNATVPVTELLATNAAANVDAVFAPKGTGALLARKPDGTTPGGNKRGVNAVDFQRTISVNTQVASGANSVLLGGARNTVSGQYAVVAGGWQNSVSNSYSSCGGGFTNAVTSTYGTCAGGDRNTVSGTYAALAGGTQVTVSGYAAASPGGQSVTASGDYSVATGAFSTTRGLHGMIAHSAGRFATTGDSQAGQYILRRQTTNATETELSGDNLNPGATTRIVLPNSHVYGFRAIITARASGGDTKTWHLEGAIKRGANAAATALVGTVLSTTYQDAGAAAWAATATADTTAGALVIKGTGALATNINWTAVIDTVEVG